MIRKADHNSETTRQQLQVLKLLARELCAVMKNISAELNSVGVERLEELEQKIELYRSESQSLSFSVSQQAGIESPEPEESLPRTRLEDLMKRIEQRDLSIERLNQIERIQHSNHDEFEPLKRCREMASTLIQELSKRPVTETDNMVQQIGQETHPLTQLLTLLKKSDHLNDEDWGRLHSSAVSTFGRELATAIVRGKLVLVSTDEQASDRNHGESNNEMA